VPANYNKKTPNHFYIFDLRTLTGESILTDEDGDSIGLLDDAPEVVALDLLDGLVAGVLLDQQPLQDAVLSLHVASIDSRLLTKVPDQAICILFIKFMSSIQYCATLIKRKIKFSSYVRKFRRERLQSYI
jgi:hypothetical protein